MNCTQSARRCAKWPLFRFPIEKLYTEDRTLAQSPVIEIPFNEYLQYPQTKLSRLPSPQAATEASSIQCVNEVLFRFLFLSVIIWCAGAQRAIHPLINLLHRGFFLAFAALRLLPTSNELTEKLNEEEIVSAAIKITRQSRGCLYVWLGWARFRSARSSCENFSNKIKFTIFLPSLTRSLSSSFCVYFQIFRSLESPAEDKRISESRENVIIHRQQFLKEVAFLSNMRNSSNFEANVLAELKKYEFVSGSAPLSLYMSVCSLVILC